MENTREEPESEVLPVGVFEVPGEPAIVINGVPEVAASNEGTMVVSSAVSDEGEGCGNNTNAKADFFGNGGFGEWLEGREVLKLFGERYYTGTVTQFDKESEWYRVVYEDGDSEDLDWNEMESVLLPLDISVPLKSLALKVLKKNQKSVHTSGRSLSKEESDRGRKTRSKGEED